jgi:hypothetical protein
MVGAVIIVVLQAQLIERHWRIDQAVCRPLKMKLVYHLTAVSKALGPVDKDGSQSFAAARHRRPVNERASCRSGCFNR